MANVTRIYGASELRKTRQSVEYIDRASRSVESDSVLLAERDQATGDQRVREVLPECQKGMPTATLRIYDELPALLADDWGKHQPTLNDALQQIRTADDAEAMALPVFRIKETLQPYPNAYQRLLDEMHLQATVHQKIVNPLQAGRLSVWYSKQ